jgi:hypothetical protein
MQYEYRNFPCTVGKWAVTGKDRVGGGAGVLEWCFNEEDAFQLMAEMHKDYKFVDLKVEYID